MEQSDERVRRARSERREYRATFSHPEGWHATEADVELLVETLGSWGGALTGQWQLPGTPPYLELWFVLPSVQGLGALRSSFRRIWKECLDGPQGDVEVSFLRT